MPSEVRVSCEHCVIWRTPNKNGENSATFIIRKRKCYFEYCKGRYFDCDYRLYLLPDSVFGEPFDLTVQLVVGTDIVSRCRITYPCEFNIIWKGHAAELKKVVPDFDQRGLTFEIILHDSTTNGHEQEIAADKCVQTPTYLDTKYELENLSRDLAKLMQDDDSSQRDVELVCGDITLKAHGSVLSARSDVFRAMLRNDTVERKTGRVEIGDAETDVLREFLQYLYSGQLPELTVDRAMQLYEIGDRYSVAGIRERCASFLTDNLARDNACAILSLADQHNDQVLRQSSISYILDEKIPIYDEYWSDFCKARPQLAIEVYNQFFRSHISKDSTKS